MKKLILAAVLSLFAMPLFATYTIFMKDGTVYKATKKWEVRNGQAIVTLENGTTLSFDPRLIDVETTEKQNALGLGDARLITTERAPAQPQNNETPLGSRVRIRPRGSSGEAPTDPSVSAPAFPELDRGILNRFQRAYENMGLFGASITQEGPDELTVRLSANSEDDVFKAISATSVLIDRTPEISKVHLLMATLTGGSAGKFEMTRQDADNLVEKRITWQAYFVQKVIL
ncbi:MAG: hypothetical protein KY459_14545 [Acidobacteria bacterium]|nr:hypothetical protein [Acidobacteriota bacterium]